MTILERQQKTAAGALAVLLSLSLLAGLGLLAEWGYHAFVAPPGPPPAAAATATPRPRATAPPSAAPSATATATEEPTPLPTATEPALVEPTPEAACRELLLDGGLETGEGWTIVDTVQTAGYVNKPAEYVSHPVRSGERSVRLGIAEGHNLYSYSAIDQSVTIPADAVGVRLGFWYYPVTDGGDEDLQYVLLIRPDGTYETLMWELAGAEDWQWREFPLDDYRGQTVTVRFGVRNDGRGATTAMYVDDVSLASCGAPVSPGNP